MRTRRLHERRSRVLSFPILTQRRLAHVRGDVRDGSVSSVAVHGRQEPGPQVAHRPGLPRDAHAVRDPAEHVRKSRLVHGLHAVPGRDLAGAPGDAPQLSNFSDGADGHGDGANAASEPSTVARHRVDGVERDATAATSSDRFPRRPTRRSSTRRPPPRKPCPCASPSAKTAKKRRP